MKELTMSETNWTAGDWRVANGTMCPLTDQYLIVESVRDGDAGEHVAFVFTDKPQNARLIAAAPELYAALDNLCRWLREPWGSDDSPANEEVVNAAYRALAKATD
jgi:hypothetical protein